MTYEELVKKLVTAYATADASAITEHVAVQFNVTGEGEGALYLEVADGKIDIQPFEYYDRDAIVTTNANVLVDISAGKLNMTDAYNKGILYVDGNLGKATLLEKIVLKKPAAKKAAEKKPAVKKTTTEKAPVKKEAAKKAPANKAESKKAATKKPATEKAPVEMTPIEKALAEKTKK